MNDVHFDFAVLLTLLTLFTGAVWAMDKWWLAPRREGGGAGGEKPNWIIDFSRSFFPVILIVLLLRSFLVEPFRIPSGSMMPTLLAGDFILVNKFVYGLRDPVFHVRFIPGRDPERGDVVVFRFPLDPSKDFIKRVIGLPGDHVAYRDKTVYINDQPVPLEPEGLYTAEGLPPPGVIYRFSEMLGEDSHPILINPSRSAEDFEFVVPEQEYFVMGDNRDGSDDSRRWGTVPEQNLVGRAFFIWMSWDASRLRPDWSRIGMSID